MTKLLGDAEYNSLVAALFKRIVKGVDGADPDSIEADATGDMVTLSTSKSGEKVIVNTQRAVQQIWVAGQGVGVHFSYENGRWVDDKNQRGELLEWVSACVNSISGLSLSL